MTACTIMKYTQVRNRSSRQKTPKWYYGVIAISSHALIVLSQGEMLSFVLYRLFPILQPTAGAQTQTQSYATPPLFSNLSIQRYIMFTTGIAEITLAIIPHYYVFVIAVILWYALWQLVSCFIGDNRFSKGINIFIPFVGVAVLSALSVNVFIYRSMYNRSYSHPFTATQHTSAVHDITGGDNA